MLLGSTNNCFGLDNRILYNLTFYTSRGRPQIYLGVTDIAEEGEFIMLDGTSYNEISNRPELIFKWQEGEPNDYGSGEDCMQMRTEHGLNDESCNKKYSLGLCEKKIIRCT